MNIEYLDNLNQIPFPHQFRSMNIAQTIFDEKKIYE